ncbi:MAG TPA: hydroxymethylglutaryl-CoA lyase [Bdellovibrionales bacterium]|nr:hydroxymethylglutaryl-CoA lyase [Bdellovibrionales bacterium]
MAKSIEIVEVGARDGLQNESRTLTVAQRLEFIKHLVHSGLKRIEVGAFVSPKWVPQMASSRELIEELYRAAPPKKGVRYSALVPNLRGMEDALKTPIDEIAVFGACSESFSKKNINCTIAESLENFKEVLKLAKKHKRPARGYLSVAFGCPYEGPVDENRVVELVRAYLKMGVFEISIGDTIGVASPKQVRSLIKKLKNKGVPLKKVALHMHDTRGTALANVLTGYDMGIKVFDSSFGGLGGCPYAKGASGNLATDDLVYMFEGMGVKTGVDLNKLLGFTKEMTNRIGHKLPSKMAEAGMPFQGADSSGSGR